MGTDATKDWLDKYRGIISDNHLSFFDGEARMTRRFEYQIYVIPGLLQTEQYARSIITLLNGHFNDALTDVYTHARMERQRRFFDRPDLEQYQVIIDESVLYRQIGSTEIFYEQLRHLAEMAEQPKVTVQIADFKSIEALALIYKTGQFVVGYNGEEPLGTWVENYAELLHAESSPITMAYYVDAFRSMSNLVLTPEKSLDLLNSVISFRT